MPNLYLIYYDNGESYGDHDNYPVLAFTTKAKATRALAKLNTWRKEARYDLPSVDFSQPDEVWMRQDEAQQAYVKSLKPLYGLTELTEALCHHEYAGFSLGTLPLIK